MNTIIKYILLVPLSFILSCNKINKNNTPSSINIQSEHLINDSIMNMAYTAVKQSDTLAYKQARRYFSINYFEKEFLYFSMTMADKYDYNQAYFDTYVILSNINSENNINDCNICEYYLLKSFEKNNHHAKNIVKEMYIEKGIKVPSAISILER